MATPGWRLEFVRRMIPWVLLALLLGCPKGGDDDAVDDDSAGDDDAADLCAAAWSLPGGAIRAEIEDFPSFEAPGGLYTLAGGLAINGVDQGLSLTLSSMFDEDGVSVIGAVEDGQFPIAITIGQNGAFAGYATVYDGPTTYVSGAEHVGWLHVSGTDGDQLVGCFEFQARETAGDAVQTWTDGLFHVPSM